jgi:hypothetical protein
MITLVLDQRSTFDPDDDLREGLSASVRQGSHFWVPNDETTNLERLTLEAARRARSPCQGRNPTLVTLE